MEDSRAFGGIFTFFFFLSLLILWDTEGKIHIDSISDLLYFSLST